MGGGEGLRGRPPKERKVGYVPPYGVYKPAGVPLEGLDEVMVRLDGLEALRLAHLEGLTQEEGAARMGVSRQTFGRVLEEAHRAVTEALIKGKALRIGCGANIICPRGRRRRRGFCGGRCDLNPQNQP